MIVYIKTDHGWMDFKCEALKIPLEDAPMDAITEWLSVRVVDGREVVVLREGIGYSDGGADGEAVYSEVLDS